MNGKCISYNVSHETANQTICTIQIDTFRIRNELVRQIWEVMEKVRERRKKDRRTGDLEAGEKGKKCERDGRIGK